LYYHQAFRGKNPEKNIMAILIDNYDSFTYNLVHYFGDLGIDVDVHRNDEVTVDEILGLSPNMIIISPGPATPDTAGICLDLIKAASEYNVPLLGICLGHQSIGQVFGGDVIRAPEPVHGKTWTMNHNAKGLFKGIADNAEFTRYHSLIIDKKTCPDCLEITATSAEDNLIMAASHRTLPIHGVQFHPESIASGAGKQLLKNFIDIAKAHHGS
jgi:anthranilate synthase component 2